MNKSLIRLRYKVFLKPKTKLTKCRLGVEWYDFRPL